MADADVLVPLPSPGVRGSGGGIGSNFLTPTSSLPPPRLLKSFSLLRRGPLPTPPFELLLLLRVTVLAAAAEPTAGDGLAGKRKRFSFPEVPGVFPLHTLIGSWLRICACGIFVIVGAGGAIEGHSLVLWWSVVKSQERLLQTLWWTVGDNIHDYFRCLAVCHSEPKTS